MARDQERPFLGEALLRLSRMLGVTGSASPLYENGSKIVPVVVLGDGTLPGYGGQSLRRFAAAFQQVGAAGQPSMVGIQASTDIIITSFEFTFTVAGIARLNYVGPSEAATFALATPAGVWVDRAVSSAEAPPLLMGGDNTGVAQTGTSIMIEDFQALSVGLQLQLFAVPFLLAAGARLYLRLSNVNTRINLNVGGMSLA